MSQISVLKSNISLFVCFLFNGIQKKLNKINANIYIVKENIDDALLCYIIKQLLINE